MCAQPWRERMWIHTQKKEKVNGRNEKKWMKRQEKKTAERKREKKKHSIVKSVF